VLSFGGHRDGNVAPKAFANCLIARYKLISNSQRITKLVPMTTEITMAKSRKVDPLGQVLRAARTAVAGLVLHLLLPRDVPWVCALLVLPGGAVVLHYILVKMGVMKDYPGEDV